ncbi:MAG: phytoene desaturase family protein [Bacteroidota bacterium]
MNQNTERSAAGKAGKNVLVIGAGLGGLSTALRLASRGYKVQIVEKYHSPGGRLNILEKDGFRFDLGPSFFSMSYEFTELFDFCGVANPLKFHPLDPLYAVFFSHRQKPYLIFKDLIKLAAQFPEEKDFEAKAAKYLASAGRLFHDTEYKIVKRNFPTLLHYGAALTTVPLKHLPLLMRSMWTELCRNFETEDVRVIFSLVAFFLGATPFNTPAVYSLLNYTELVHDGYWNVEGGMYRITEEMVKLLEDKGVSITYNTEIVSAETEGSGLQSFTDQNGKKWIADLYVANSDAAWFRGKVLNRKKFNTPKLDKMDWTLAPFTIYLGVRGKIENLHHHTYFLGSNFNEYAEGIFRTAVSPEKPYYYVNAGSKSNPACAPEGCENLFILCPVPDLRYKSHWDDKETLADNIIADLSQRTGFPIAENTITRTILTPEDWRDSFNLYQGSGLGLAHGLNQVGGLRPANKDEVFSNLYYVGASTIPGTGLPIVVISSKLVAERVLQDYPL